MTNQQIITSVQALLQDNQFPPIKITEAANWLQQQLFANTETRIMEASDIISVSAGQVTADLPSDIQVSISMYLVSPPPILDMDKLFMNHESFLSNYANWQVAPPTVLTNWTDFSNQLRFSAPLLANAVIDIDYIRTPVNMVALNDVCEIPNLYQEIISRGTLARCMEQNEDYGEAKTERENLNPLIVSFIKQEARGRIKSGPIIIKTNRRKSGMGGRSSFNGFNNQ